MNGAGVGENVDKGEGVLFDKNFDGGIGRIVG